MIRRVRVAEGEVELADEGPRGAECIVLLHGFTGSKESWRTLRERLSRRRRVVAVDLPGHGGTRVAVGSMDEAAAIVSAALGRLGIGDHSLVGYSMGGRLALHLSLCHGGGVRALVLESASAGLADPAERRRRVAADEELARRIEMEGIEAFVRDWEALPLFGTLRDLPAEERMRLRRQRLACDPAGLAASLRGMGTGTQRWLGGRLGELRLPVLAVAGERDAKFAAIARDLVSRIPAARLALVPGAGHVPHLERREAFEDLVEGFLDALALRPGIGRTTRPANHGADVLLSPRGESS